MHDSIISRDLTVKCQTMNFFRPGSSFVSGHVKTKKDSFICPESQAIRTIPLVHLYTMPSAAPASAISDDPQLEVSDGDEEMVREESPRRPSNLDNDDANDNEQRAIEDEPCRRWLLYVIAVVACIVVCIGIVVAGAVLFQEFFEDEDDCALSTNTGTNVSDVSSSTPTVSPSLTPTEPQLSTEPLTVTAQLLTNNPQHDRLGSSVALSNDGQVLAVGSANGWLVYDAIDADATEWSLRTDSLASQRRLGDWQQRQLQPSIDRGIQVTLSGNGNMLGVLNPSLGTVQIFSWSTTDTSWSLVDSSAINFAVQSLGVSEDGDTVVVGGEGMFQSYRYLPSTNDLFYRGMLSGTDDNDSAFGSLVDLSVHGEVVVTNIASDQVAAFVWDYDTQSWASYGSPMPASPTGAPIDSLCLSSLGKITAFGSGGSVYVYEFNGNDWVPLGNQPLQGSDASFGRSLAMDTSGSVIAVGAQESDAWATNAGEVRFYSLAGDTWVDRHDPTYGAFPEDEWGASVAVTNARVAIGATQNDLASFGYIAVFSRG